MKNCTRVPKKSFGSITFGQLVEPLLASGELVQNPDGLSYYDKHRDCTINTHKSKIESIRAFKELIYKGVNLIGLDETSLIDLVGEGVERGIGVSYDDGSVQYPLEWPDLGLLIWVDHDDRILSISCYDPD